MPDTSDTCKTSSPRIGIALGGGAERGFAHIGVLRALEQNGIFPAFISGSSAGAFVAGFYASGIGIDRMIHIGARIKWRTLQRMTLPVLALSTNEPLRRFLKMTLPAKTFDQLKIPLRVVTTDLLTAEMVVYQGGPGLHPRGLIQDPDITFETGDLIEAIRASCTRPVINRPVQIGERLLVDGCLTNNVPAMLVRDMGADIVIGVDLLTSHGKASRPKNIFSYAVRTQAIHLHWALKNKHSAADVLIRPDFNISDQDGFTKIEGIIQAGHNAAELAIPAIHSAIVQFRAGV